MLAGKSVRSRTFSFAASASVMMLPPPTCTSRERNVRPGTRQDQRGLGQTMPLHPDRPMVTASQLRLKRVTCIFFAITCTSHPDLQL